MRACNWRNLAMWPGCWHSWKCHMVSGLHWHCGHRLLSHADAIWLVPMIDRQLWINLWMHVWSASISCHMAGLV